MSRSCSLNISTFTSKTQLHKKRNRLSHSNKFLLFIPNEKKNSNICCHPSVLSLSFLSDPHSTHQDTISSRHVCRGGCLCVRRKKEVKSTHREAKIVHCLSFLNSNCCIEFRCGGTATTACSNERTASPLIWLQVLFDEHVVEQVCRCRHGVRSNLSQVRMPTNFDGHLHVHKYVLAVESRVPASSFIYLSFFRVLHPPRFSTKPIRWTMQCCC